MAGFFYNVASRQPDNSYKVVLCYAWVALRLLVGSSQHFLPPLFFSLTSSLLSLAFFLFPFFFFSSLFSCSSTLLFFLFLFPFTSFYQFSCSSPSPPLPLISFSLSHFLSFFLFATNTRCSRQAKRSTSIRRQFSLKSVLAQCESKDVSSLLNRC